LSHAARRMREMALLDREMWYFQLLHEKAWQKY
jgi:hypothetical protein